LESNKHIVVVGGGIAGICAALSASAGDYKVTLIESSNQLGGNLIQSNVGTICGAYLRSEEKAIPVGNAFTQTIIEEIKEFVGHAPERNNEGLYYLPYDWRKLLLFFQNKLSSVAVNVMLNTSIQDIVLTDQRITKIRLDTVEQTNLEVESVIDCSGSAFISKLLEQPLLTSDQYQSASQIFRVSGVLPNNEFALNMSLKKMVAQFTDDYNWPESYKLTSVIPGSIREDKVDIKLTLPNKITDTTSNQTLSVLGKKAAEAFFAIMKKEIQSFQDASLYRVFKETGIRTLTRPEGKIVLTENDVLTTQKRKDGVCVGAWPIEYWNPKGKLELTTFDFEDYYLIPAGSLISKQVSNLYFAGKSISATEAATASARVVRTCIQMAYAAGQLALNVGDEAQSTQKMRNELMVGTEHI
jgi:hypothetical protein